VVLRSFRKIWQMTGGWPWACHWKGEQRPQTPMPDRGGMEPIRPGSQLMWSSAVGSHGGRRCPTAPFLNNRVGHTLCKFIQGLESPEHFESGSPKPDSKSQSCQRPLDTNTAASAYMVRGFFRRSYSSGPRFLCSAAPSGPVPVGHLNLFRGSPR